MLVPTRRHTTPPKPCRPARANRGACCPAGHGPSDPRRKPVDPPRGSACRDVPLRCRGAPTGTEANERAWSRRFGGTRPMTASCSAADYDPTVLPGGLGEWAIRRVPSSSKMGDLLRRRRPGGSLAFVWRDPRCRRRSSQESYGRRMRPFCLGPAQACFTGAA